MSWKSTLALLLCPPLLASCGGGGERRPASARGAVADTVATVRASPFPALEAEEVAPETEAMRLTGDLEMRVDSVLAVGGDTLSVSDTLLLATDTLSLLEAERIRMEASMLYSMPQGADSARAESLLEAAATLQRPKAVVGDRAGVAIGMMVEAGDAISPGDTLALVRSGSAHTRLRLPEGASLEEWPPLAGEAPVETQAAAAVYSLPLEGRESLRFSGVWLVRRDALRDRGLDSYVVAGTDTVGVRRLGSWGDSVVVAGPLAGLDLRTW